MLTGRETASPTWIDIVLSFNHKLIQRRRGNGKSSLIRVLIKAGYHILSNADIKSTKITNASLLFAAVVNLRSSISDKIRVYNLLPAVKPDCSSI